MTRKQQETSETYTDYTKRFRLWRLTFSVSLPWWTRFLTQWLFHPIASLQEYLHLKRARALEEKWTALFSTALKNKPAPEFEFDPDPKNKGRVIGLKETPSEASLPSVGVWSAPYEDGALDRAIDSSGLPVTWDPAPEELVEERRQRIDKESRQWIGDVDEAPITKK